MKTLNIKMTITTLFTALSLSACGQIGGIDAQTVSGNGSTYSSATATGTSTGTSLDSSSTESTSNLLPLITKTFSNQINSASSSFVVSAGKKLKMKFSAQASSSSQYCSYNYLQLNVTVNGTIMQTHFTPTGNTDSIINLSGLLSACNGKASTCRANVAITINHALSDVYYSLQTGCVNTNYYAYALPNALKWNANFDFETDDTVALD